MTKKEFFQALKALEIRFRHMEPEAEITLRDPKLGLEGYIVIWNSLHSPELGFCAKGGTRISPKTSLDEIRQLAQTMALKNAAAGLPLGGAKSGICAKPDHPDFERVYRRFVTLSKPFLRESGGVFGGFGFDIGAKPEHALWACDELGSKNSFTGKSREMGGTDCDKEGIAGLGVTVAAETLLGLRGLEPKETSFAVQGLGALGSAVFRYFSEAGAKAKYISDTRLGGSYFLNKPIPKELHQSIIEMDFKRTARFLEAGSFPKADLDEVLYQKVDILFPCAVQNVIHRFNAKRICARAIVEGANNPADERTRTELFRRGIKIVPDFLANPGGIIAAFVELSEASSQDANAKIEKAKNLTREKVGANTLKALSLADKLGVESSQAAKYIALSKLFPEQIAKPEAPLVAKDRIKKQTLPNNVVYPIIQDSSQDTPEHLN